MNREAAQLTKKINGPNDEAFEFRLDDALDKEITSFSALLDNDTFLKSLKSTRKFWLTHGEKMPLLKNLAIIISNVSSSSAFIERFFSICGIICDTRSANMKDDLVETRCLLKANISLLNLLAESK